MLKNCFNSANLPRKVFEKVQFAAGAKVKKGDILFLIDNKPYKSQLNFANAEQEKAKVKYELAKKYNSNLLGAVTWAFEFENQPWFYGFRDLATNGVDKPVLNVFRMFGKMQGDFVEATSDRAYSLQMALDSSFRGAKTDIGTLATKRQKTASILVWNYHDVDIKGEKTQVSIEIAGINASSATLIHYRIDDEHSNSYELWKKMGSPKEPTSQQIVELEKAGQLTQVNKPQKVSISKGHLKLSTDLPRQAVDLFQVNW